MSNNNKSIHPIYNSAEFFIETPMVIALKEQLNAWLQNGVTGAAIFGPYRSGKSRAIEYASQELYNRLDQKIPARLLTIHRRTSKTETSIFRNLCFALSLVPKARATTDEMSNLVFHHFCDLAQQNDTKQVALFIDEVHRLTVDQLEAFCEIYDKLTKVKVNISIFFIGNKNTSKPLIKLIDLERNELIRGRFFIQRYEYCGLRNIKDVRKTLAQYDKLKYPKQEGVTYTNYFAAKRCGDDFRLCDLADIIWEVFSDNYRSKLSIKAWPMQYFIATIKMLLVDYLPKYGVDDEGRLYQSVYESIEASELVSSLVRAA